MASPETKTIRQIMDPEGTLPVVELVPDPGVPHPSNRPPERVAIMHEGTAIGKANMERVSTAARTHEVWLNGVNVVEQIDGKPIRGHGYGMAAHIAAMEAAHANGDTFRTHDLTHTEASARVWAKFIDAGIAQVVEPFRPVSVTTTTGEVINGLYAGHAQILPPESPVLHAEGGGGGQRVGGGSGVAEQRVVAT